MTTLRSHPTQQTTLPSNGYTRIMPLANFLNIHHQTLRRWIKQCKIPAPKVVNGVKLFSNAEIIHWLETGEVNPSTDKEGVMSNKLPTNKDLAEYLDQELPLMQLDNDSLINDINEVLSFNPLEILELIDTEIEPLPDIEVEPLPDIEVELLELNIKLMNDLEGFEDE